MKLNIGENLRRLRREQNMTQETLAEKLGTSFQSVSRWENGTTYPDIEFLPAIARIFGTTVDNLIGCDSNPSDEEMEQIMNAFSEALEDESIDNAVIIEQIRSLRRDYAADEHIWRIFGDMMYTETQRWRDPAVMEELRITCREVMTYPHPTWLKNAMVQYMSAIEDDEHLDDFLNTYASDRDISRISLLWSRYTNREEWDKLEQFRVHRLYEHIDSLLGDRGLWRNPGTPNDAWESRWINERKIAILHTICSCTPDADHPVSGDGSVDIFAADRVWMGIRHACYLASTGEEEDAFVYLEDAVSLAEHVFSLPDETEIGCGCKSFAGLTLYLHNERANPTDENSSRLAQFRNYSRVEESGIGYYGTPLFANGIYNALTAEHGWEWFDPIRDDTRYPAYIERIRALL